jgi:hypothetical protein
MSEYVAFKDTTLMYSGAPATHAIVIGVGGYPHLNNGDPDTLTDLHGGLGQLSSPPASARAITTWLLKEFYNPEKPLATVSLLISEQDAPQAYTHEKLAVPFTPQPATSSHVKAAVNAWKDFGDSHEENLMLFFFCGHGVARGLDGLTLLLSDYGALKNMPMDGAVDFAALHRGMSQCAAAYQCYFVDACRTVSDIATQTTATGQQLIQDNTDRPWASDWNYAIFYSTLGGEQAYGRKNKPSFYTEELIKALNGTGSNNRNGTGDWRVSTGDLSIALHRGLSLRGDKIKVPMSAMVQFEFHQLRNEPLVPIMVYCDSDDDTELAEFACLQDGHTLYSRTPQSDKWVTEVPHGTYDFLAKVDSRKGERKDESVIPPYRDIEITLEAGA